jgi:hypothetical protein
LLERQELGHPAKMKAITAGKKKSDAIDALPALSKSQRRLVHKAQRHRTYSYSEPRRAAAERERGIFPPFAGGVPLRNGHALKGQALKRQTK